MAELQSSRVETRRDHSPDEADAGLVPALRNLTQGVETLVKEHLRLFQLELKRDASQTAERVGILVVCGIVLFFGYVLFHAAAILTAYAFFGVEEAAITAIILTALNVLGAAAFSYAVIRRMQHQPRLDATSDEVDRSKEWMKRLPSTTS